MNIENDIFKKYTPDYNKLIEYGFSKNKTVYQYEKFFENNEFKAVIEISKNGIITGKVIELENNDEFLPLKIETQQGIFVGIIREEYKRILIDIRDNCFSKNYFIFPQSNRITHLIISKYENKPDFMWEQFEGYGVFKNANNNKWYGIIMNINYSKLGLDSNNPVEIINIKLDKDKIPELLKKDGYYPAWHMNKKSWITITLDETVSDDEIIKLISESYSFTIEPKKEWIVPANPKYFDIIQSFEEQDEIIWKQSSKIKKGDIVYMYVANPISAIRFKCEVTEINIPYDYEDKNLKIEKVMKIKLLKKYNKNFMTFEKLNKYGINAIRGQRTCPKELAKVLK